MQQDNCSIVLYRVLKVKVFTFSRDWDDRPLLTVYPVYSPLTVMMRLIEILTITHFDR